jgi:hypothetical protein
MNSRKPIVSSLPQGRWKKHASDSSLTPVMSLSVFELYPADASPQGYSKHSNRWTIISSSQTRNRTSTTLHYNTRQATDRSLHNPGTLYEGQHCYTRSYSSVCSGRRVSSCLSYCLGLASMIEAHLVFNWKLCAWRFRQVPLSSIVLTQYSRCTSPACIIESMYQSVYQASEIARGPVYCQSTSCRVSGAPVTRVCLRVGESAPR